MTDDTPQSLFPSSDLRRPSSGLRRPSSTVRRPKSQPDRPWQSPHLEDADIFALQAVAKGIANDAQQKRAFDYVVRVLCETDRMTFWPGGEDGRRATDFAEGKRWVGVQLRRVEKLRPDHRNETADSS
jgi:hypothetical protein